MKQKITIAFILTIISITIFWACKEEDLPEIPSNNKIELTIIEDSTSYVFSEIICNFNQLPNFIIEQYGFCWDTLASVNIEKQSNALVNLTNLTFQETIEELLPNTTYYVKSYIQNGDIIIYSNELMVQTLDARPNVSTNDITNILAKSAESGGIADAYEVLFPITQRGICWAKTQNPSIADSLTINGTGNGTFTSQLQHLDIGINYYVKAYAINSEGISYGEEKSFSALDGIPNLTTDSIRNITATSATFYGNIIENDGLEILEKGFCWNTSTNPIIENNFAVVSENVLGSYSYNLSSLTVNTNYYIRAYIKNSEGTFYGTEIIFTTNDGLSSVTTNTINNITAVSAECSGSITDDGEFPITARGVCWSVSENPTITDAYTTDGTGTGNFTSSLTSLTANTIYYVRAYATNVNGTTYGNQINFTTLDGVPILTTISISNITATSATSGGNITDDGGSAITARGICWNTSTNPTITNDTTKNGNGIGTFTSDLTGLDANTIYYVRTYATNDVGITYGNEQSFTTNDGIPTITTTSIIGITATSATSGGDITDDGGLSITTRGVCWSTNQNPTITDAHTTDGNGTGAFTSNLTGLVVNTIYYVRSYATNAISTVYGNEISFNTLDGLPNGLTTTAISDITAITATSGGNITDDGGFAITARGICWSTSQNPTITEAHTTNGTGMGSFTSSLTGLDVNTTYYVRAYATNSIGTVYDNEISFTTLNGLPNGITTTVITNITATTATSGGNITDDGGFTITTRGVCWSASQNPTITDAHTTDGTGTGSFTSSLTGLVAITTYYVRSYATNENGTTYGNEISFVARNMVIDYDGNIYGIVTIGNQIWMAENLKTTHYADGTAIQLVESSASWDALLYTDKAMCYYDNSSTNADTYGALYTWAAAMNGAASSSVNPSGIQGACPAGWHLPSDAEWTELTDNLGSSKGGDMKEIGISHWKSPNLGANNVTDFTALPGGSRDYNSTFNSLEYNTRFWSATESNGSLARVLSLYHDEYLVFQSSVDKRYGLSVRCIKD
jgi:uncharacterized protein (TIGR02145 family)